MLRDLRLKLLELAREASEASRGDASAMESTLVRLSAELCKIAR